MLLQEKITRYAWEKWVYASTVKIIAISEIYNMSVSVYFVSESQVI
jgi:hypothetical protein